MSMSNPGLSTMTGAGGLAAAVHERISDAVSLGLLAVGAQLPRETALARQLGVSIITVRAALATLRADEIIVTRRGRTGGSFVNDAPGIDEASRTQRIRALTPSQVRDFADELTAIECRTAELAALRHTMEDLARVRRLIDDLAAATTTTIRAQVEARLHIELAVASQSERLTARQMQLQAVCVRHYWETKHTAWEADIAGEHERIFVAIAAGDEAAARAAAAAHATTGRLRMLTRLAEDVI